MTSFLFYLWASLAIFSSLKVITTKNPILSVFWLVFAFLNASLLLLLVGLEFLPLLFVIVYVGAIAILFLFVVMLLNIKLVEITENTTRYAPIAILVGFFLLFSILNSSEVINTFIKMTTEELIPNLDNITDINLMAEILYTDFSSYFLISSLILLVSMVGAIVLCLFHETSVKRQDLFAQVSTNFSNLNG